MNIRVVFLITFFVSVCLGCLNSCLKTESKETKSDNDNANAKIGSRSLSTPIDLHKQDQYGVYLSLIQYPIKVYVYHSDRVPSESEYSKMLADLPWDIPNGIESVTYTTTKDPKQGMIKCLDRDLVSSIEFPVGLAPATDPGFSEGCSNCDNWSDISDDPQTIYHLLRASFIKEFLQTGAGLYKFYNGKSPSSLEDIEKILGIKPKAGLDWLDYGLSFDFGSAKPKVIYKNSSLPEKFQGTADLEYLKITTGRDGKVIESYSLP